MFLFFVACMGVVRVLSSVGDSKPTPNYQVQPMDKIDMEKIKSFISHMGKLKGDHEVQPQENDSEDMKRPGETEAAYAERVRSMTKSNTDNGEKGVAK